MNRVTKRAGIMLIFVLLLVGGLGFFVWEFFTLSDQWVIFSGSPHVYENSSTGSGIVTDREGILLLDTRKDRSFSEDGKIRQAVLHWLGDRQGNIATRVMGDYVAEMSGFDHLDGVYAYGDVAGEATLTISARVQTAALEAMAGRKGTVAVYNYRTGEILCALTTPTFDPDNVPNIGADTSGKYEGVYVNRFVHSAYIPGSIFKLVTTAAALETVEDITEQTFKCTGIYEFGVDKVTCERAHGSQDLKSALANSCNCAFAQIAQLIGADAMMDAVNRYGITAPVSFDGVTTIGGNYDVTDAAAVELAWSCIGQYTDQINPCRFMTFMGMIAGGGRAAEPHMVSEIRVGEEVTYRAETVMSEQILDEDTARILAGYMANNVQSVYGAGNFPGLTVCAKSGTSQLGGGKTSNAMFAGFVSDEEYPLAFICVVENGGYGASTCVPVLSKVLAACKAALDAG